MFHGWKGVPAERVLQSIASGLYEVPMVGVGLPISLIMRRAHPT